MRIQPLAVIGLLAAVPAGAATIVNGSFETSNPSPGGIFFTVAGGDTTTLAGWTVGGESIDVIGGYWQAADGINSVDLSGNNPGSLAQTIATTVGQAYTVTFALAGNPDGGVKTLAVGATGAADRRYSFDTAGHDTGNMGWQDKAFHFTATGSATTLTFTSLTAGAAGPVLDKVAIVDGGVPEPATWTLMVAGFGVVGLRRRAAAPGAGGPGRDAATA